MARMLLLLTLATLMGCQSVGITLKATPSKLDPSRFEYSVEFTDSVPRRR
jgi:hypothetical protein